MDLGTGQPGHVCVCVCVCLCVCADSSVQKGLQLSETGGWDITQEEVLARVS